VLIVYLIERNVLEESLVPFSLSVIIALPFLKLRREGKQFGTFIVTYIALILLATKRNGTKRNLNVPALFSRLSIFWKLTI